MDTQVYQLIDWTTSKGVMLNGITPKRLPGRGIGVVATRKLTANEDILVIPTGLLKTLDNAPKFLVDKLEGARVHAILAAWLVLDKSATMDIWRGVLPTREELLPLMPFCWPPELQAMLPLHGTRTLIQQRANFSKDWGCVQEAFGDEISRDDFVYAWMLVNTRTFYHKGKKSQSRHTDDHMALQPVADLLNHAPHGCSVTYDDKEFTITTVREHEVGEEIFISYGSHSNDVLLVQYGFTLPAPINPWDELCLDRYLCPRLIAAKQKDRLEDAGFWEKYMLDSTTPCYRTEVALRSLCLTPVQWQAVLDGERDEDADRQIMNEELLKILHLAEQDVHRHLDNLDILTAGDDEMRETLKARWNQLGTLIAHAIERIEG